MAAMNPCPCGYYGDESRQCDCTADQINRYWSRLSGPLLDRIDLHVDVPPLPAGVLSATIQPSDDQQDWLTIMSKVRAHAWARQGKLNSKLDSRHMDRICHLNDDDRKFLDHSVARLGISARGYFKILKIARTIADLSERPEIQTNNIIEALSYRRLDRK